MTDHVTPEELARELGVSGRAVRSYLRSTYPSHFRWARWRLSEREAAGVRAHFRSASSQ